MIERRDEAGIGRILLGDAKPRDIDLGNMVRARHRVIAILLV